MDISRRDALSGMGCLALGAASGLLAAPVKSTDKKSMAVPWPYAELNADRVAERAYKNYFSHHCMYASFEAIVGQLADQFGEPFSSFPFAMMVYGGGGVAGWGTLCGTLNGAAAAIQLLSHHPTTLISELYRWHEVTALPNVELNVPADKDGLYPASSRVEPSVSGSVLCHIIMSKWLKESGHDMGSAEKKQRCAQAAASVAKKTVELLNDDSHGELVLRHQLSKKTQSCSTCHTGVDSLVKNTQGKMECMTCHADHTK